MTEVNGLRLAYRGLLGGLAAGYAWLAASLVASAAWGDPLAPHGRLIATLLPMPVDREGTFLLGLATAQLAGGLFGILFAYFIGRFFTVRGTLALAAPSVALLAWLLLTSPAGPDLAGHLPLLAATLLYGIMLGMHLPVRREVLRYSAGSPST